MPSFLTQVKLANQLAELRDDGIQVLLATHSPILTATPGARIIELDEDGFQPRAWNELMTVALYRRFLTDPGYFGLE
jgi:predicted ATPase